MTNFIYKNTKVQLDGREWVDLKTYEDRVTYGLVNLID